jgi:hypothetical protein
VMCPSDTHCYTHCDVHREDVSKRAAVCAARRATTYDAMCDLIIATRRAVMSIKKCTVMYVIVHTAMHAAGHAAVHHHALRYATIL